MMLVEKLCSSVMPSKTLTYVVGVLFAINFALYVVWCYRPELFDAYLPAQLSNRTITPNIEGNVFLLILINSIPKTADRRQVLRETWAGTAKSTLPARSQNLDVNFHSELGVYCVFLVAFSGIIAEDNKVRRESSKHGDILRIDTEESYRNMITKVWAGFEWAQKIAPKFLMKVDDDVYVDIPHLMYWLFDETSLPSKLYAGWVLHHGRVMRVANSQWYVSHAEFHERYFPDYCIGPFYVISGNILGTILTNKAQVKMFNVEDAYLGVLMRNLHISPLNIGDKFVWDPRLPNMIPKWKDKKFSEVICLGERLTSQLLRFIHGKYWNIHKKGYGSNNTSSSKATKPGAVLADIFSYIIIIALFK